jgi:hypothetical protein
MPSEDLTPEEQLAANNAQLAANNKRISELEAEIAALQLATIKHDQEAAAVLAAVP